MNTVHMNGYDIDIRRRPDGKIDVSQHCTNGRIGASRFILNSEEELNEYLAKKGLDTDVFEKAGSTNKSDVDVKPEKNDVVAYPYAKLVTLFPSLAPIIGGNLISKGAEIFEKNGIHNVDDYKDAYKEFNDDFTQVLLPRSMRENPSDEDFNRRLDNIFLPRAYRKGA